MQIQGQLLITEEKYCDFVCWTQKSIFADTITLHTNFKAHIPLLKKFFVHIILPEFLNHKFKNGTVEMASTNIAVIKISSIVFVVKINQEDVIILTVLLSGSITHAWE